MSTQVDWSRELDAAIPRGPDRAPDAYRTAGRSAVRRRRAGAVALTLAATVVAGAGVWAATPGPSSSLPATPAATEGSTPSPTPDTDRPDPSESPTADPRPEGISSPPRTATRDEISLLGSGPHMLDADYTPDGDLVVRPGWTVATFENNPMGAVPPATSAGLELTKGDETTWMLLERSADGSSISQDVPGKRFARFDDWLADQVALRQGDEEQPVAWTLRGMIATQPGTEVLETVEQPKEAAAYGEPAEMVAAKLRLADGRVVFALAGPEGGTAVDPAVLDAPTMAAFLRHLAAQGDSGEGLR